MAVVLEDRTARLTILINPRRKTLFERLYTPEDVTPSRLERRLIRRCIEERSGLRVHGIATTGLSGKPWAEFFGLHKSRVHFLISLCEVGGDNVNWEYGGGERVRVRWEMPDPATVVGSDVDIRFAFEEAFGTLQSRFRKFLALSLGRLSDRALSRELALIGDEPSDRYGSEWIYEKIKGFPRSPCRFMRPSSSARPLRASKARDVVSSLRLQRDPKPDASRCT